MSQDPNTDTVDFTKIEPWNPSELNVKVNSIRYNQDYSLLTLGTSKGYRIFLTSNLRMGHEPTEEVKNLGDVNIAMTYYKSSLIFFLPSRNNNNFTNKEIVVFDDFTQTKLASIKDKTEEILNFYVSKNVIYLITLSNIIVMEIFSFKIIDIINNINSMNQVLSFNNFNIIAYSELKEKKKIFIRYYHNEKNKIISYNKKDINHNFDYIQAIQLSPAGDILALVSIYGNKMHLYYTQSGELKDCFYLNQYMQTVEKIIFSKKSNYLLLLKNDKKFSIYKIGKEKNKKLKCVCSKYDDSKVTTQNKEENNTGIFGYFRKYSKNKDIKDPHAYSEVEGNLLFIDFDRNINKDLLIINEKGQFIKYHFKKKTCGRIAPILTIQWE